MKKEEYSMKFIAVVVILVVVFLLISSLWIWLGFWRIGIPLLVVLLLLYLFKKYLEKYKPQSKINIHVDNLIEDVKELLIGTI